MTDAPAVTGDLAHLALVGTSAATSPADANRTAASAQLERLKADPEFVKRHLSGDHATKAEIEKLCTIIAAPREGTTLQGGPTAEAQRADAADFMAANGHGLSPQHIAEIRNGTPNSPEIYAEAMRLKKSLMGDPAWRAKYFNNDHETRRTMLLINIIESNPVAS
jgi:hypothetical protein